MQKEERQRKRNAAATKEAILKSAQKAFAEGSYEAAGLREIAQEAGVTAMMVNRYFGSKEQLFTEVLVSMMSNPDIIKSEYLDSENIADLLAAALVDKTDRKRDPLDGFKVLLHSLSNPKTAEIGREQITKYHLRQIAESVQGEMAAERSAIALSLIFGFQIMRQMIALDALASADPVKIKTILADMLRLVLGSSEPETGEPKLPR